MLREWLDLPEVALVAIMDADIEGFLRNYRSLIQTVGRAARNTESKVIFYADKFTDSMKRAIDETDRRREVQVAYNKEHGITPTTVQREVKKSISDFQKAIKEASSASKNKTKLTGRKTRASKEEIEQLKKDMQRAAENLDFERAIKIRNQLRDVKEERTYTKS